VGSSISRFAPVWILFSSPAHSSRPGFERFAHVPISRASSRARSCADSIGARGQLGDPLHLLAQSPAGGAGWPSELAMVLKGPEHPRHDGDIAFGVSANLVERR
jgi:hypothetical protein